MSGAVLQGLVGLADYIRRIASEVIVAQRHRAKPVIGCFFKGLFECWSFGIWGFRYFGI